MEQKSKEFIDRWESQVRKGLLEFIILSYLSDKEYYGYELISEIKRFTSIDIAEGTIYPLLNRLKKEDLVTSKWVEMQTGVPRKYYQITKLGREILMNMKNSWEELNSSLQSLVFEDAKGRRAEK